MLFLQLNPGVPLYPLNLVALTVTLALFYGVHLVVGFYALIVLREMIGTERLSPGWVSLRLQSWLLDGGRGRGGDAHVVEPARRTPAC